MKSRIFCVIPLLIGLNCGAGRGVWVRVADAGCSALVEITDDDDTVAHLCLVAVDLVKLLGELRAAEKVGAPCTVRVVDAAGAPTVYVVPARHVGAAALSVRAAMEAK